MTLAGKNILIGITGGIAAYKVYELIRLFIKNGANVKTVLTPHAKEFVTETTLRTLTKNPVYTEQYSVTEWKPEHINLADETDLFVVAPATANTIGKIANGICDNLLTSLIAAYKKKTLIAPAMNCNMWINPFVQENIKKLEHHGFCIIPPESGELACGYEGTGRLTSVDKIFEYSLKLLTEQKPLQGQKVVITAGGTKEPIDPVRYIANKSSGKMGIAIADTAHQLGAEVVLISTVPTQKPYKIVMVETAEEMLKEVLTSFKNADSLIMSAAVADYRIKEYSSHKIKKTDNDSITLELVKNPDILKEVSKVKTPAQKVIGFCAESRELVQSAKNKIQSKKLDFIIANDISNPETGFGSDYNQAIIIDSNGDSVAELPKMTKQNMAEIILEKTLINEVASTK